MRIEREPETRELDGEGKEREGERNEGQL